MIDISIVVPCFNAIGKIEACINSLLAIDYPTEQYEVLFIDDCSTDETYTYLKQQSRLNSNWKVFQLDVNSGSPSAPRNRGVIAATGKYIFYLDCDDEIYPDTLSVYFTKAEKEKADIIRGYLITDDGSKRVAANKIQNSKFNFLPKNEKIEIIVKQQSTTVPSFILRELLIENNIEWDVSLRMGEDTVYLINVLARATNIFYINHPTFIYNKKVNSEASSTQSYGARELRNHLKVWRIAQERLSLLNINYYAIRLQVGLQTAIQSMIQYNRFDISTDDFGELYSFVIENKKIIEQFNYNKRLKEVLEQIYSSNYEGFIQVIKQRLVIAGYDLKFILTMVPSLETFYQIKIDEWTGHNSHNEKNSNSLLDWADIVFCEWMLGNAVWYSNRVKEHQKLFIRMHRFELTTKWFTQIDFRRVNRVFAVSLYFFEKLIEYTGIPRSMACLLPNYVDSDNYQRSDDPKKLFNIGIIGVLPSRKGYLNALRILKKLVEKDQRYRLFVYGKMPQDLSWVKNDSREMEYYTQCEEYISEHELEHNIEVKGWVDVKTELKDVGFILSTSENEEIPESFHLAPADGFSAGNQGLLLQWNGVEYIYPSKYIFSRINDIATHILSNNKLSIFNYFNKDAVNLIEKRYSLDNVVKNLVNIIRISNRNYGYIPIMNNKKLKSDKAEILLFELSEERRLLEDFEIILPSYCKSSCKIIIEYNFQVLGKEIENGALLSLGSSLIRPIAGFTLSDIKSIGLYKYLITNVSDVTHMISFDISENSAITSLLFKLWDRRSHIIIKNLIVKIEI